MRLMTEDSFGITPVSTDMVSGSSLLTTEVYLHPICFAKEFSGIYLV
jgi:hypothetical protein